MPRKQMTAAQLKNLPQYKNKTDEELEQIAADILRGGTDDRVEEVLEELMRDYDISDLAANDELTLRSLALTFVRLEDVETMMDEAVADGDANKVARLQQVRASMIKDASSMQTDLNITRKARRGDKEADLVTYIEDLKLRAKKQLDDRLSYIYCPKCKMLLATAWFLYPDEEPNTIRLKCKRLVNYDEGIYCDHVFTVTSEELKEKGNKNLEDVLDT